MNDHTPPTTPWIELNKQEKGEAIRPFIEEGLLSYSEIARIVGTSRTAIAGAADRNDIKSPLQGDAARKSRTKRPRKQGIKFSRIAPTQPIALPTDLVDRSPLKAGAWTPLTGSTPKALHDLEQHDCRWPLGEAPFNFCGQPAAPGHVYCAVHAAMAYKPWPEGRKKGTAS